MILPVEAWEPDFEDPGGWCVRDSEGRFVCQLCDETSARQIARALNSWPALVDACEQSLREIDRLYDGFQLAASLKDNATYKKLLAALKTAGRAYIKLVAPEEPMDRT